VIHPAGGYTCRVLSDGKLGRSYTVEPHGWRCDCPDSRRRESACKHAIACWVLERAYPPPKPKFAANPGFTIRTSQSLRNAVPLYVAMAGLERMSA
jgi:hypothetical protein